MTFGSVYRERNRSRPLKPSSIQTYDSAVRRYLADWEDLPLRALTFERVSVRYRNLVDNHGPAQANVAMAVVGAVHHFASMVHRDPQGRSLYPDNPVTRLRELGGWRNIPKRDRYVSPDQLPAWLKEKTSSSAREILEKDIAEPPALGPSLYCISDRRQEAGAGV